MNIRCKIFGHKVLADDLSFNRFRERTGGCLCRCRRCAEHVYVDWDTYIYVKEE